MAGGPVCVCDVIMPLVEESDAVCLGDLCVML